MLSSCHTDSAMLKQSIPRVLPYVNQNVKLPFKFSRKASVFQVKRPRRPCSNESNSTFFSGEDFYTILGVAPNSETKDIKKAYYQLMREFHPDVTTDQDATEFCSILNEIYEILTDSQKRQMYDALSGFVGNGINPFYDKSFAQDQVFVDEVSCIGCGKCVRSCPGTFAIEASKYGRARVIKQGLDSVEDIAIAIETCPVDCIHWVTLPQLPLLETALSSMARVEVYIMMRTGRSAGNVFEVAMKAWQKRQDKMKAFQRTAVQTGIFSWNPWDDSSSNVEGRNESRQEDAFYDSGPQTATRTKVATLAAMAARAARLWRAAKREVDVEPVHFISSSSSARE